MIMATLWIGFTEKIWQWLDSADKSLFLAINDSGSNAFMDAVFPWYRDSSTWLPLYIFLLLFVTLNFGWKSLPWITALIVTAALSDQISSNFLKNTLERTRPCNDMFIMLKGHLRINRCPSSFSFTSSHATNHFAAAMFIYITMKPAFKKWTWLFFVWAATICYGQVYVGVHYPLDVIGGGFVGCLIGYGVANLFNKYYPLSHHLYGVEV
jgi:membrane-associated phospholipid phosphatase